MEARIRATGPGLLRPPGQGLGRILPHSLQGTCGPRTSDFWSPELRGSIPVS